MSVFYNYAKALIADSGTSEALTYASDLQEICKLTQSEDFESLIQNPGLSSKRKVELLERPLQDINPKVKNLVFALIKRGHSNNLKEAFREISFHIEKYSGIEEAVIQSPVELSESDISGLQQSLQSILSKKLKIKVVIDKSLIAGFKVQVCGKLFDNSLSSHLRKIKERFDSVEGFYES